VSKQDQAARIAAFSWTATIEPENSELAKRIRRAINSAVRKERERCVGIATSVHGSNMHGGRGEGAWACEDIIKAIKGGVYVKAGPVDDR